MSNEETVVRLVSPLDATTPDNSAQFIPDTVAPDTPPSLKVLNFADRFLTSTVNSAGNPTADIEPAEAATPTQRRRSARVVSITRAMPTLNEPPFTEKPEAESVAIAPLLSNPPPAPTKRSAPVNSTVSSSMGVVPLRPPKLTPV